MHWSLANRLAEIAYELVETHAAGIIHRTWIVGLLELVAGAIAIPAAEPIKRLAHHRDDLIIRSLHAGVRLDHRRHIGHEAAIGHVLEFGRLAYRDRRARRQRVFKCRRAGLGLAED